jgi:protein-S-isoprenylcysteine O-methyltransferase Ste14
MRMIAHPYPVGMPGLALLAAGGIVFFAVLLKRRRAVRGEGAPGKKSSLSLVGIFAQMLGFAAVGLGPIVATLPPFSPPALLHAALVALFMGLSVALFVSATRAMGENWSFVARMRTDHQLVTSGIFAHLRHPIYVGMAMFLIALTIAFGHFVNLAVGAPLFLIGTWIRVREEEKLLRAQFGAAYDDYAGRVKRFVPGLI